MQGDGGRGRLIQFCSLRAIRHGPQIAAIEVLRQCQTAPGQFLIESDCGIIHNHVGILRTLKYLRPKGSHRGSVGRCGHCGVVIAKE